LVLRLEVPGLDGVRLEKAVGVHGRLVFGRDFVQPSGFRYLAPEGVGAPAADAVRAFMSFVKSMWATPQHGQGGGPEPEGARR
jgi:hypothetical protein